MKNIYTNTYITKCIFKKRSSAMCGHFICASWVNQAVTRLNSPFQTRRLWPYMIQLTRGPKQMCIHRLLWRTNKKFFACKKEENTIKPWGVMFLTNFMDLKCTQKLAKLYLQCIEELCIRPALLDFVSVWVCICRFDPYHSGLLHWYFGNRAILSKSDICKPESTSILKQKIFKSGLI